MFVLRGIAVSLSIFVLLYGLLSAVVCGVWRKVLHYGHRYPAKCCADILFSLRMIPLLTATGLTLALAVPSFLTLEPRAVDEPMGAALVVLGLCGAGVLLLGVWKAARALLQASQTVARWSGAEEKAGSHVVESGGPVSLSLSLPLSLSLSLPSALLSVSSLSLRRISATAPPLTAAGILRPSVWLSRAAEFVLTARELEAALRHEVVHVRRWDNLRKLILRLVVFPGMAELENAWREATEMAADDAAVSTASEALDLAAAVIKLSRLTPLEPPVELTTALVCSPAESLNARVERLIAWTDRPQDAGPGYSVGYALCAAVAVVAVLAASYSEVLVQVHAATEWLVK